jgi:hypothetical protein
VEGGLEVLEFLLATTLKAELPFCDVEEDGFLFWEGEDDLDNSLLLKSPARNVAQNSNQYSFNN